MLHCLMAATVVTDRTHHGGPPEKRHFQGVFYWGGEVFCGQTAQGPSSSVPALQTEP